MGNGETSGEGELKRKGRWGRRKDGGGWKRIRIKDFYVR